MNTNGRRNTKWTVVVCLAALGLAGCGSDGTSSAVVAGPEMPSVAGTVIAPDGEFARLTPPWQWADALTLVGRADALQGVAGVSTPQTVSLSRLDPVAAGHGCAPQRPCLQLITSTRTDSAGRFQISHGALGDLNADHLILHVGDEPLLTRAFVFSRTADINASSEAVVRLVLLRLTQAPPVQLNVFTNDALQTLADLADVLTAHLSATGSDVASFNEKVYDTLAVSGTMHKTMDELTSGAAAQ